MDCRRKVIENMNIAKAVLCNQNMITSEMCIKIGQTISDALTLLKEHEAEWIYGEDETGADGWHCSECNFFEPWFYDFDDDMDFIKRYEYCPKCKSRMTSYTGKLKETKMIEQDLTLVPTPSYPIAYCGCDLSFKSPKYKEDCYFYGETNDMGAIIRFCTRGEIEWGHCPCEKCDQFLSKEEVDRVARSIQKGVSSDG